MAGASGLTAELLQLLLVLALVTVSLTAVVVVTHAGTVATEEDVVLPTCISLLGDFSTVAVPTRGIGSSDALADGTKILRSQWSISMAICWVHTISALT